MNHSLWEIGCYKEVREYSREIQMSLIIVVSKEALLMEWPKLQVSNKYGWKKNELDCLVVHITLKASESHSWFFDSGCSCHMTSNRSFFTNFTEFNGGNVTFGDGNVASVKEKDNLCSWNP